MNLRNVLRAYGLLRSLSDDESALLNILRALNDSDREQLVATMSDKPQKKSSKKAAGGGGKSKRGESLAKQISGRAQLPIQPPATSNDSDDDVRCTKMIGGEKGLEPCEERADHNIHHMVTHPGHHEFVAPPASSAAGAGD